jgi:hypothetical protein
VGGRKGEAEGAHGSGSAADQQRGTGDARLAALRGTEQAGEHEREPGAQEQQGKPCAPPGGPRRDQSGGAVQDRRHPHNGGELAQVVEVGAAQAAASSNAVTAKRITMTSTALAR